MVASLNILWGSEDKAQTPTRMGGDNFYERRKKSRKGGGYVPSTTSGTAWRAKPRGGTIDGIDYDDPVALPNRHLSYRASDEDDVENIMDLYTGSSHVSNLVPGGGATSASIPKTRRVKEKRTRPPLPDSHPYGALVPVDPPYTGYDDVGGFSSSAASYADFYDAGSDMEGRRVQKAGPAPSGILRGKPGFSSSSGSRKEEDDGNEEEEEEEQEEDDDDISVSVKKHQDKQEDEEYEEHGAARGQCLRNKQKQHTKHAPVPRLGYHDDHGEEEGEEDREVDQDHYLASRFDQDTPSSKQQRFPSSMYMLEIALYIITGILLIFVMEQFIQIGIHIGRASAARSSMLY